MTPEAHKKRHVELHIALDELVGDWLDKTGKLPSKASVLELIQWSHEQTKADTGEPVATGRPRKSCATRRSRPRPCPCVSAKPT